MKSPFVSARMLRLSMVACVVVLCAPCGPARPDPAQGDWSFVAVPESRCANGTSTGFAVNAGEDPEGLLVFMRGGGACWDAETCLVDKTAARLDQEIGEPRLVARAQALSGPFDRTDARNPFARYAFVMLPYCTGDLHTGTRAQSYVGKDGPVTIMHYGARNLDAFLPRITSRFPNVTRVVVLGNSAGGYGATFNWPRYQRAFPRARVDVLSDSGPMIDAGDARFEDMVAAWGTQLPEGCADCGKRLSAWLPFYATQLPAPHRYALLATLGDRVIASYLGLTESEMRAELLAARRAAASNQKTWFVEGSGHGVMGDQPIWVATKKKAVQQWVAAFASDAPDWDHGP